MLIVEGYKMAEGIATIKFLNDVEQKVDGVFLYRPDKDLWYVAPCRDYPWGGTFSRDELIKIDEGSKKRDRRAEI